MFRLFKSIFLISFLLFFCPACVFAEDITITTYYPSPYGSYNELQLYPHTPALTPCDAAHGIGTMFYDSLTSQVKVCQGAAGWQAVGASAPSGFCVFSDTQASCPAGWTRRTQFDGRTVRGASTPGGTGGSATHTHSLVPNGQFAWGVWGAGYTTPTMDASSWPPYTDVLICCKD